MNEHYRTIKLVSQNMEGWVRNYLNDFGIYECSFSRYDINNSRWIAMPIFYNWHCEYIEKNLMSNYQVDLKSG